MERRLGVRTAPRMTNRFRVGKHEFSRLPFPFSINIKTSAPQAGLLLEGQRVFNSGTGGQN